MSSTAQLISPTDTLLADYERLLSRNQHLKRRYRTRRTALTFYRRSWCTVQLNLLHNVNSSRDQRENRRQQLAPGPLPLSRSSSVVSPRATSVASTLEPRFVSDNTWND
jgi:hypothetical protein